MHSQRSKKKEHRRRLRRIPIEEDDKDPDFQLPANGAADDEGLFEVAMDDYNNNLYLR